MITLIYVCIFKVLSVFYILVKFVVNIFFSMPLFRSVSHIFLQLTWWVIGEFCFIVADKFKDVSICHWITVWISALVVIFGIAQNLTNIDAKNLKILVVKSWNYLNIYFAKYTVRRFSACYIAKIDRYNRLFIFKAKDRIQEFKYRPYHWATFTDPHLFF